MITIPAYDTLDRITIFRDDEDLTRFYYLPRQPRIALAEEGGPQFSFMYYALPVKRPGTNLEAAGGYLVFTTLLTEPTDVIEKIRTTLQARYVSEHPDEVTPRHVTLAPVEFTGGEVRLIMMENNQFIKAFKLGRPSLFGDNTASVAVELSELGANLFYQALEQGASVAAIEYDLTFPVRLPAIQIIGHIDCKEVRQMLQAYGIETTGGHGTWGTEEEQERQPTAVAEIMESQGLITLQIIKGDIDLSEEEIEPLRAFAFRAMDQFIKDNFLKGSSAATEAERRQLYLTYVNSEPQELTARFDLNVTYRDVIARPYNPSAQINPSFLGVPLEQVLFKLDLDNTWYKNLEVKIDTNFDFAKYGEFVHSVVGHLSYDQPRPDGTRLVTRESVAFTADDNKPKTFLTRIADTGRDIYHVDVEVNYKGGPVLQRKLASYETTTRDLTLHAPNPGVMEVEFAADPQVFSDNLLQSTEVEVEYADLKNRVPAIVDSFVLTKDKPQYQYKRVIYAPWTQPYRYRCTYVVKGDNDNLQRSTDDWIEARGEIDQKSYVKVHTPFDGSFCLTLIPSADWSEVQEVIVDLEYKDEANDYTVTASKSFSEQAKSSIKWQFPLRNPEQRAFQYRQLWLMKNGASTQKDWAPRDQDGTLIVGNALGGVVTLTVDPADLDLGGSIKRVFVRLRYDDEPNQVTDTVTLLFKDKVSQTWSIARMDANVNDYLYDLTYVMADNTQRNLTGQRGKIGGIQDYLMLPPEPPA